MKGNRFSSSHLHTHDSSKRIYSYKITIFFPERLFRFRKKNKGEENKEPDIKCLFRHFADIAINLK